MIDGGTRDRTLRSGNDGKLDFPVRVTGHVQPSDGGLLFLACLD
jgi:hypothetical protein